MDEVITRQTSFTPAGESSSISEVLSRLERIENALDRLVTERTIKDWYSTREVAEILGKAEFTVREWCRLERVHAVKRACGRGNAQEWAISHEELVRISNHGLLPVAKYRLHG